MKIVKDKNNVVVFAWKDLDLTSDGLIGDGFKAPFCTTKDYTIEEVGSFPSDWSGGHYTYDKKWEKTAIGLEVEQKKLDAIAAEQAKIAEEKAKIETIEKAKADIMTAKTEAEGKALSMVYLDKRLTALEKILGV